MIALGLGSNLETSDKTREENIITALKLLNAHPQIRVEKISPLYLSEPVGFTEQADFLNCAAIVTTSLTPRGLLEACLATEKQMGRQRIIRWGPRNIDIDLLFYGETVVREEDLELPHPRMSERKFVLLPLVDIAPDFPTHKKKTPRDMLRETLDKSAVEKYDSRVFQNFLNLLQTNKRCGE